MIPVWLKARLGLWRSLLLYRSNPVAGRRLRAFCRRFAGHGDLVFDIGAHVGNRSRAFAATGARVVALEPQPVFARYLEKHVAGPSITVLRSAVGAGAGQGTLAVSHRHPTVSTMALDWIDDVGTTDGFDHVRWGGRAAVDVTTLDALIALYGMPAFVKIDVEGYELEVLKGLSHPLAALSFEYLPASLDRASACMDAVSALGTYRYNAVVGEGCDFAFADWLDGETLKARLPDLCRSGRSGDIYARLVDAHATEGSRLDQA